MNTHTTAQQHTTDSDVSKERKKTRQLTADDIAKMGEFRFLGIIQVAGKLDISKSTIYDWLNEKSPRYDPTFPKPVKINEKSVTWIFTDIEDWMRLKVTLSRGEKNEESSTLTTQ